MVKQVEVSPFDSGGGGGGGGDRGGRFGANTIEQGNKIISNKLHIHHAPLFDMKNCSLVYH